MQTRNVRALRRVLDRYEGQRIVVGSHGTALGTIINYYCPTFSFADFERIRPLMPWIVHFQFDGEKCIVVEEHNILEGL